MTVRFNTTVVRDGESSGSLTFIVVTNRPADVSFTVQVCTENIDLGSDLGMATGNHSYKMFLRVYSCYVLYILNTYMHIGVIISVGVAV